MREHWWLRREREWLSEEVSLGRVTLRIVMSERVMLSRCGLIPRSFFTWSVCKTQYHNESEGHYLLPPGSGSQLWWSSGLSLY